MINKGFTHNSYLFRKSVFKLFGGAFRVFSPDGQLVFYSRQKAFRLKEDFRIYSDESMREELLTIQTPHIFDFSSVYNVTDTYSKQAIGAVKRKGFKSIISDEWLFMSEDGREIGKLKEKSMGAALLSRFINLVPQHYIITDVNGRQIAFIDQHFNPFVLKYTLTFNEAQPAIDKRLILSAGILLCGIEGRQQ
jgi:uncharacterized protein YxjI